MRLCDLDEIKICVDRQYENCHGYSGSKKAIYREAILAVKSILHSAKPIDGVTVQEWISVDDRLPEHGDVVLCFMKFGGQRLLLWDGVSSRWLGYGLGDDWKKTDVANWMPLPNPPKGE